MTTIVQAIAAATTELLAQFTADGFAGDAIEWENVEADTEAWNAHDRRLRVRFRHDETNLVEVGGGHTERTLIVAFVQLLFPIGEGPLPALTQAEAWADAFGQTTRGGLCWLTASAQPVGRDGDRYLVNLRLPFENERVKP